MPLGLETIISATMIAILGEFALGIIILVVLFGMCFILKIPFDGLLALALPIFGVAFVFIPELKIMFGLVTGVLIGIGFLRVMNR